MNTAFASPDMVPEILSLWMDAFPNDTKQDVCGFLEAAFSPERCLVMLDNGRPISMVFMLTAELEFDKTGSLKKPFPLQYIYAAATLTAYRRQGIFGRLLEKALETARGQGMQASFLRPAEPGLYSYYKRFGYRPFFWAVTEQVSRTQFLTESCCADKPTEIRISGGMAERGRLLQKNSVWVCWPDYLLNYALESAEKNGGGSIAVDGGWALCEPAGSFLMVREWLCEPRAETALRCAVDERFHADAVVLRKPAVFSSDPGAEPFGMICPLTKEADRLLVQFEDQWPYMGLAFD